MDQTALTQRAGHGALDRADQPGRAVGDDQQGWAQTTRLQAVEELVPGVVALVAGRLQADQHRLTGGGDAPRREHRLGPGTLVHLEVRIVDEQVVQLHLVQTPAAPGVELVPDGLADPRHGRLGQRRLRPERVSQGSLHITHGQAAHEPGDHQGLQRVGLGHAGVEQPGHELLVGAAQLRPIQGDRPAVVFTVVGQYPLREPARASGTSVRRW